MRLIEVNADFGRIDTVASIAEHQGAVDFCLGFKGEDGRQIMRIQIADDRALQKRKEKKKMPPS